MTRGREAAHAAHQPLHLGVVLVEGAEAGMVGLARVGLRGIAELDAPRVEHAWTVGRAG